MNRSDMMATRERVGFVVGEAHPNITEGRVRSAFSGLLRGTYTEVYIVGTTQEVNRALNVRTKMNRELRAQDKPEIPWSKISLAGASKDVMDNGFSFERLAVENGLPKGSIVVVETSVWNEKRAGYTIRKKVGDLYSVETHGVDDRKEIGWARRHILEPFQHFLTFLAGDGTTVVKDWWNTSTASIRRKAYKGDKDYLR